MKLSLPRRRIVRAAIYFVSFALILLALDLVWVQMRREIHSGYDTTRIIAPTLPDGAVDYLAAIENFYSRGVTADNNAAIPILQALGRAALPKNQPEDGITNRLGMPHLSGQGDYYITYDAYSRQHSAEQDDVDASDLDESTIWPVTFKPATIDWVNANDNPLALLAEAAKRSRYFVPFNGGNRPTTLVSVLIPHVGLLRDTRRALLTRALLRLDAGSVEGFQSDIRTAHRLAGLQGQDSTIVGRLVGLAMEVSTCRVERFALSSGKLSPPQIRQMLDELSSMPESPPLVDSVDHGERYMCMDVLQGMAKGNYHQRSELFRAVAGGSQPDFVFCLWPISYDDCMRTLNSFYDGAIVAVRQPTYPQRVEALNLYNQMLSRLAASNRIGRFLSADWPPVLLIPSLIKFMERTDSARTEDDLTRTALALALFKSDHGEYPAALSELSPAYLANLPVDIFSDKPPIYSRNAKGFTLYSIGPNMKDNQGKGDDIVASAP